MITVKDAYENVKRANPNLTYAYYTDTDANWMFCFSDPDIWTTVDKKTGKIGEISLMTEMINTFETNPAYSDELVSASKKAKPIEDLI